MADLHGSIAPSFFDVFGEFLTEEALARTHDRVVQEIIEAAIETRNVDELAWVVVTAERHDDILPSVSSNEASHLLQTIDAVQSEITDEDSIVPLMVRLKSLLVGD
jgi:hypothetical protein